MRILLLPLGLLAALAAQAQNTPAATTPAAAPASMAVRREYVGSDTPPEPRAERETDLLAGQLSLSPEQRQQVYAAALAQAKARQAKLRRLEASHASGFFPPDAEDQAIADEFEARLKAICTPAQYQKHQLVQARFRRLRARYDSLQRVQPGGGR